MFELNKNWKYKPSPGPQVCAYTTTYNCLLGGYPVEDSIKSFSWCDKIIVVDGGSTDGTRELLNTLCEKHPNLAVYDIPMDMSNPRKDGEQKGMALAMVDTPISIQFDIDEICCGTSDQWRDLIKDMKDNVDILSLPVLEPIGKKGRMRMNKEFTPWKWRIIRVKPEITHGVPRQDRLEVDGEVYSRGGSDGCFPVHIVTNELIPSRPTKRASNLTKLKAEGDKDSYKAEILELLTSGEPHILHLGHVDLAKKISHYLSSWRGWWCKLYNKDEKDPNNNVYFPGIAAEDVTQQMIEEKAKEIMENTPYVDIE